MFDQKEYCRHDRIHVSKSTLSHLPTLLSTSSAIEDVDGVDMVDIGLSKGWSKSLPIAKWSTNKSITESSDINLRTKECSQRKEKIEMG